MVGPVSRARSGCARRVGGRAERGMTLVELMITMIIASIVAASTFMFFTGQQRIYETQTKMLNVQQNVWAAMEVLARFVRASGGGMFTCVRPPIRTGVTDVGDPPPVVRGVHDFSQRPNTGLRAYTADPAPGTQRIPPLWIVDQYDSADGTVIGGNNVGKTGPVIGTDAITVAFGNASSGTDFDSPLATTAAPVVNVNDVNDTLTLLAGRGSMFRIGEFIVLVGEGQPGMNGVPNDRGCTLFQITNRNMPAADTLVHKNGANACVPGPVESVCPGSPWNPPTNPSAAVQEMIPGASSYGPPDAVPPAVPTVNANTGVRNFGQLTWVRFAIRLDAGGIPGLTMERLDDQLEGGKGTGVQFLAEGIEDLQVAYACDTLTAAGTPGSDGALTEGAPGNRAKDEWLLNDPTTADEIPQPLTAAENCNQPTAVRLTLIARSLTADDGIDPILSSNGRPAAENHAAATSAQRDQYRRRVLTTTVYPRNN